MATEELVSRAGPESSAVVARRVHRSWEHALRRNGGRPNAELQGRQLLAVCALPGSARRTLAELGEQLDLTGRGVHRVMRVGRTIADLRGAGSVESEDLLAAAALRDRSLEQVSGA